MIKCECNSFYIGQTGRSFLTRFNEHTSATSKSTFGKHFIESGHKVGDVNECVKPLYILSKGKKMDLFESLEICKHKTMDNLLNDQTDLSTSPLFTGLIQ